MKFEPRGLLALSPTAYGQDFEHVRAETQWIGGTGPRASDECAPATTQRPALAVVWIRGPLMHHTQPWAQGQPVPPDSYDDIRARVAWALSVRPQALVLSIDSPGGLVSGCFDGARAVRAMCDAAGVSLHAYIDGQCCSAAYAWACACETITAPPEAVVGSIGVLDTVLDATAADSQMGLKFALIASGARKTDSNPHVPMTPEALAAVQVRVDDLAAHFFKFVADRRIGLSADSVRALQAETFVGERAKSLQLVDNVMTFDALVASLTQTKDPTGKTNMAKSALLAAIVSAMASDDEDEKKQARKAMSAICAEDGDGEDKPKPKEDEARATTEEEEPPAKKKEDEASAAAAPAAIASSAAAGAVAVASSIDARLAKIEEGHKEERMRARAAERKTLLAARPDINPTMLAVLNDPKQTPLESLRAILPTIPQPTGAAPAVAQTAKAPTAGDPVTGAHAAATVDRDGYSKADLDAKMGLGKYNIKAGFHGSDPTMFVQPTLTPAEARAQLAAQAQKATAQ